MEYQRRPLSSTASSVFPRRFTEKHAYEGVFASSVAVGRNSGDEEREKYREIFAGGGGSIPVLDVNEELKQCKAASNFSVDDDARRESGKVDYGKIFGGFRDVDYDVVSYEDLVSSTRKNTKKKKRETSFSQLEESRTVGDEDQQGLIGSGDSSSSPEASFPLPDNLKQFTVSYNKSNPGVKNGRNVTTHVAQVDAVPGYTRVIDGTSPLRVNDGCDGNVSGRMNEGGLPRKFVSGPLPKGVAYDGTPFTRDKVSNSPSHSRSDSNGIGSLSRSTSKLPPFSSPPPNLSGYRGANGIGRTASSKFGFSSGDAFDAAAGNNSPPLFDEEIDANSAAAASADAVRKAIEEARAKIKIARELMERKKVGVSSHVKMNFNNGYKDDTREVKNSEENSSRAKENWEMASKAVPPRPVRAVLPDQKAVRASQVSADGKSRAKEAVGGTLSTESTLTQLNQRLEQAELMKPPFVNEHDNSKSYIARSPENDGRSNVSTSGGNVLGEESNAEDSGRNYQEVERVKQEKFKSVINAVETMFGWNIFRNHDKSTEELHQQTEYEDNLEVSDKHEEPDQIPKAFYEHEAIASKPTRLQDPDESVGFQMNDTEVRQSQDWVDVEMERTESGNHRNMDANLQEILSTEENDENKLDDVPKRTINLKEHEGVWERVEFEMGQEDLWNQEENDEKLDEAHITESHEQEAMEHNDVLINEECEQRLGENDVETHDKQEIANENEKGEEDTVEGVAYTEKLESEFLQTVENVNHMEAVVESFRSTENNSESTGEENNMDDTIKLEDKIEVEEATVEEHGRSAQSTDSLDDREISNESKAAEEGDYLNEEELSASSSTAQVSGGLNETDEPTIDDEEHIGVCSDGACSPEADMNSQHIQNNHDVEYQELQHQERNSEDEISVFNANDHDVNESDVGSNNEDDENSYASSRSEKSSDNGDESRMPSYAEVHDKEVLSDFGSEEHNAKDSEMSSSQEYMSPQRSTRRKRWADNMIGNGTCSLSWVFEGKEKTLKIYQEEDNRSESTHKEDKNCKTTTDEERENDGSLRKEVNVDNKRRREVEAAKERDIEKEKERIAVEKAIREARERAFAEARERALAEARERALAEAREKAAAERAGAKSNQKVADRPQEKLERASKAANSKLSSEKAAMEAKLKAERAAVERATAEARERALEKALSEKSTSRARSRPQSTASQSTGASRNDGVPYRDQHTGPGVQSSSRYPSSSNHGGSHSSERPSGPNNELAQRPKPISEKDQRAAERAAKALAEKNMRELLAQREQAERNRLAETLDASVKRWSSGKERNLRALLSTLQHILAPDSGWQPIPLTELKSSAAVKKAYRKATLLVHPDKLQQRGASIQQKYVCEKVFELLKDAWNRFNIEDR